MGVQYTMPATEYHGFSCQFRTFRFSSSYTCFFFFFFIHLFYCFSLDNVFSYFSSSLSHSLFLAFSLNTHRTAHTRNALREITAIKIRRETKRDRWLSKILMELQWKDRNLSQGPVTRRYGPDPRPDYRAIVCIIFQLSRLPSNFIGFVSRFSHSTNIFRLFETRKRHFHLNKISCAISFFRFDREKWSRSGRFPRIISIFCTISNSSSHLHRDNNTITSILSNGGVEENEFPSRK